MKSIPFGSPIIDEEEIAAVTDVLNGPVLVHGPRATKFEHAFAQWTHSPHAVSLSSCTAGLHLLYVDLGIGPGDEVIVPAQTHTATVHAVEFTGAKPIFIDCELTTGNIDIRQIDAAISPRTRAISVVHFLGMPVAMDKVCALAKKHDLFVVEDCALSLGAHYRGQHVGLWGDAGCYSFYPVKHMTTAEGGMLISKHADLTERIKHIRAFGVDRMVTERTVPGVYDVTALGFNYRMNEIEAAIGLVQLKRMEGFLEQRRCNYEVLQEGLSHIEELQLLQSTHGDFRSSYYCLSVILRETLRPKRLALIEHLQKREVGTSVYYPRPVPHFSYYCDKYGFSAESFPNAAAVSYGSIALPVGPHLDEDDMHLIVTTLKNAIHEVSHDTI